MASAGSSSGLLNLLLEATRKQANEAKGLSDTIAVPVSPINILRPLLCAILPRPADTARYNPAFRAILQRSMSVVFADAELARKKSVQANPSETIARAQRLFMRHGGPDVQKMAEDVNTMQLQVSDQRRVFSGHLSRC
jgi:hypothetical protein